MSGSGSGKGGGGPCSKCNHICGNAGSLTRHQNACTGPTTKPTTAPVDESAQEDPQVEVGQLVIKRNPKELTDNERVMIPEAVIEITTLLKREGQAPDKVIFLTEEISVLLNRSNRSNRSKGPSSDGARAIEFSMAVKRGGVVGEAYTYKASTTEALAATVSSALEFMLMNEKPWERRETIAGSRVLAVDGNRIRVSAELSMEDFGVYWKTIPRLQVGGDDAEEDAEEAAVTTLLATSVPTEADLIAQADAHLTLLEQETVANRASHMRQRRAELDSEIPEPKQGDAEAEDAAAVQIAANWKAARVEAWEKFPSSAEAATFNRALAEYKQCVEAAKEAREAVDKLLLPAAPQMRPHRSSATGSSSAAVLLPAAPQMRPHSSSATGALGKRLRRSE